jgi:3-hydroxyacyl-CoA dehydrogenase
VPDPLARQLIEQSSAAKGVNRRSLTPDEIQRRALLAMVNEAALLLAEGVTSRATDVDVVMVNGYGFPRARGGPIFWAREQGEQEFEDSLDWLGRSSGAGFIRGNTRYLRSGS